MRSSRRSGLSLALALTLTVVLGAWSPAHAQTTTTKDKDKSTTTTAKDKDKAKSTATTVTGTAETLVLKSYGVAVKGTPELAAQPSAKISACPGEDTAAAAGAEAGSVLQTGALAVSSKCTRDAGSNSVGSKVDVATVEVGSGSNKITVDAVSAACAATSGGSKGGVVISGLEVGGSAISTTDVAPNTPLPVEDGFSGTLNEQSTKGGTLSVNALRLKQGAVEVIVGHVECNAALASAAGPATTITTKAPAPTVHDDKAVAKPKGKAKGLADTGASTGALVVLAVGALLLGALLRIGTDGVAAVVPRRKDRSTPAPPSEFRPARSWEARAPRR